MQSSPDRRASLQRLRHFHEMAGYLGNEPRDERSCAGLHIATAVIEVGQFLAQVDDLEVNEAAAGVAAVVLGRLHQHGTQAGFLTMRIDREQAQVGSFVSRLYVDTACECSIFLGH